MFGESFILPKQMLEAKKAKQPAKKRAASAAKHASKRSPRKPSAQRSR